MHGWLAFLSALLATLGVVFLFEALYGAVVFGLNAQMLAVFAVVLIVIAAIASWLLYAAIKAQYVPIKTGEEALVGAEGVAVTDLKPKGEVRVNGEFWQAVSEDGFIVSEQPVEVVGIKGMFLVVKVSEEKT